MDKEWYRTKLMKPTDRDYFGNLGTLKPSNKYRIIVSTSKDTEITKVGWLKDCEQNFVCYKIK